MANTEPFSPSLEIAVAALSQDAHIPIGSHTVQPAAIAGSKPDCPI